MIRITFCVGLFAATLLACSEDDEMVLSAVSNDEQPTQEQPTEISSTANAGSIMELMVARITPATDILWGVDDPQTDADWRVLIDAADAIITAFEKTKLGGTGTNDAQWAADSRWQDYANEVISAAEDAKRAIKDRNMDALYDANDALYTPCETCHIDFNPGVQGEY